MEKKIITISREFGSGGRTIGHKVAERLGIPFYDKELVNQVALESGFAPKFVEEHGEHSPSSSLFSYAFAPQRGLHSEGSSRRAAYLHFRGYGLPRRPHRPSVR